MRGQASAAEEEHAMSGPDSHPDLAPPADRQDQRSRLLPAIPAVARRTRPVLGRARQAHRLDQAIYQSAERLLRRRCPYRLVRGRHAQRLAQLHRPPPRRARRPDRDPVGGRRSRRGPPRHLPRAARGGVPARQCAEGAGREERRSRHDLPADDPRSGGRDAGLRPHRRDPFGRVRRLLARQPRRPHPGLPLDRADHRR